MRVDLPGGTYAVSLEYFIPYGQTIDGQAVLEIATQDPGVNNQVVPLGNKVGSWVRLATFITLDPRAKERTFYLEAQRGQTATTPFTVYYDNLVVHLLM
jgi:hypothetical protein